MIIGNIKRVLCKAQKSKIKYFVVTDTSREVEINEEDFYIYSDLINRRGKNERTSSRN